MRTALPFVTPERRHSLLAAVDALTSRVTARSAVTAACLHFRAFFLARPDVFYADPATGLPLISEEEAAGWLRVRLQPVKQCPVYFTIVPNRLTENEYSLCSCSRLNV